MGSPAKPTPDQRASLERSSELALLESPRWLKPGEGGATVKFGLPRQAVSLLVFEWDRDPK